MRAAVLRANLRSSGGRLWAAGMTIVISVAFIVAGMLLADSLTRGIEETGAEAIGGADAVLESFELYADEGEEAVAWMPARSLARTPPAQGLAA